MSPPSLSIVIPTYNESTRLPATLPTLLARCGGTENEIIVVDDGSEDATVEVARRIFDGIPRTHVIEREHRGKGAAVRAGMLAATGDAVLFMDADLATDLSAVDAVIEALERTDIVVGSRAVPGAIVRDGTRLRVVMGRAFNGMVRVLTRLPVHDTQCGFKAFRAPAAKVLFGMSRIDGFAFDAEALHHARILGFSVTELPVVWTAVDGSSVRPVADSVATAFDLLRVIVRSRPGRVRAAARRLGWQAADETAPVGGSTA